MIAANFRKQERGEHKTLVMIVCGQLFFSSIDERPTSLHCDTTVLASIKIAVASPVASGPGVN